VTDPLLEVDALRYVYGDGPTAFVALDELSFDAADGEFVSIVGPSGSGKTTLLRCLSGLMPPSGGEVRLRGRAVTEVPKELALVFQEYSRSLFPWMTVRDNVDMPLRHLGLSRSERDSRIGAALSEVSLTDAAGKYPWQLSGGMQQRVAIARALAYQPTILLMDEPFGSVDAQTRSDLQDTLLDVWRRHQSTIVFVTHDIDESVYLADRVVVLSKAPARVVASIPVDLPRPRDQIATKELPRFVELRAEVARLIRRPAATEGPLAEADAEAESAPTAPVSAPRSESGPNLGTP
jgi:NitT/TauT family transport system ATP-binding protein